MQRNRWQEDASVEFASRSWYLGPCKRFVALSLFTITTENLKWRSRLKVWLSFNWRQNDHNKTILADLEGWHWGLRRVQRWKEVGRPSWRSLYILASPSWNWHFEIICLSSSIYWLTVWPYYLYCALLFKWKNAQKQNKKNEASLFISVAKNSAFHESISGVLREMMRANANKDNFETDQCKKIINKE